jgi:ABC-type bacteriocin/lantibiotic exporter with double-glycine peptidase domain
VKSFDIKHVLQKEAHCGPASIEILFSFYDLDVPQEDIVEAAKMTDTIVSAQGMRIDELNRGVEALYPDGEYVLLGKYNCSIEDLEQVTGDLRLPAGVEWQGKFPKPGGGYRNRGHYSIVTGVDQPNGVIKLADPAARNTLTENGELSIEEFEKRWWEIDTVPLPTNSKAARPIQNSRLIFVVANRENAESLKTLGFERPTLAFMWDYSTPPNPAPLD